MSVLVDTSVWVDHLRSGDSDLRELLERTAVLVHPFVIGEVALGSLRDRVQVLGLLRQLPSAPVASADEVLAMVDRYDLGGVGIGYVDAHLLASARLAGARVWTRDARLARQAQRLGVDRPGR